MGKKDEAAAHKHRAQSVIRLLKQHYRSPLLTAQQEKFCNEECVERFVKGKGGNVKKAAKQLINCLSWRDSFGTDKLMADEFCGELSEGVAYVAGHDDELRPVMIFRIKQGSHKLFTRLVVFTLEVAIQTMTTDVHQFVILFDASVLRSASGLMNMLVSTLKVICDYYPLRLYKAFVIDPPSLFSYLWKGVRPFLELSSLTTVISTLDFEEPLQFDNSRATSRCFDPSPTATLGSCSSSRFSFTVSHQFDSLKPWYLSLKDTSGSKSGQTDIPRALSGPSISPLNTRSLSYSSPMQRNGFFTSTPMPQKTPKIDPSTIRHPRTPKLSFFQSPSLYFRKDCQSSRDEQKLSESFLPFLKFYRQSYDEMIYRSKMRPPLGGLISIVPPQLKRRHMSISQRF